ncbi:hypothetical protein CTEN210_02929 [Chaetoceros tenuissimus]|uniref:Ankyrin repeat-containing domain n=1 Tax=Chaetoceros tenuissimus TaxID=426638 RepID=A0AAD3CKR3_9STRA|nr:hypothetical protein CTEN210_02929 [Chaetoceros tenuissimus]
MSQRKRARVEDDHRSESSSSCAHIQDLPDDLFQYCLEFVGKGNFMFVAPVSKFFYWNYISQGVQMKNNMLDVDAVLQQGRNKYTSPHAVCNGSMRLATNVFLDAPLRIQHKACRLAAIEGRKDILECAYSLDVSLPEAMTVDRQEVLEKIVTGRHLEVIKFLLMKGRIEEIKSKAFVDKLLSKGHVLDVCWMVENELITRQNAVSMKYSLAEQGHFDILKRKFRRNDRNYQTFLMSAAKGGQLEIFNWLLQRGNCTWDLHLFRCAAFGGSIPILEQCLENNCPSDASICVAAMKLKDNKAKALNTLKWLRENGILWNEQTCEVAAESGNLEALMWAKSNGCPWDVKAISVAVIRGDLPLIEYCLANGCRSNYVLYKVAFFPFPSEMAKGDIKTPETKLDIFKLLHHHGVPWNKSVSNEAAEQLHFPALTWALQNGCPWDDDIYHMAMRKCSKSLLKYCIENDRVPTNRNVYVDAIEYPSERRSIKPHTEVIQLLQLFREYDVPMDESVIDCAVRLQRLKVLRWLRCNGCPCRPDQQQHLDALDN